MRSFVCSLADFGAVIWLLGVLLWYVAWYLVYSRTTSQKLSTWMFRWETPMLFVYMLFSFGTMLLMAEMNACFSIGMTVPFESQ
jgi:ABC-type Na+ efflux pump permease subunit